MTRQRLRSAAVALWVAVCGTAPAAAQPPITTPQEQFGFHFGDDYHLATYRQIAEYWQRLASQSDRLVLRQIGRTAEGRPHWMAVVTSPENHRRLERYREISTRLARAEGLTDEQARELAREGRAVVWIDGGLHATETLGAQQLGEMVYQLASRTDDETLRFLDDLIILLVHANPDGNDLVADWYMRHPVPEQRSLDGLPRLYQKYIGHDNNRDFFASTQPETENINRVLYHDWLPQILYNHHQSGPAGTVLWTPPLRDPFNYNLDPLVVLGMQAVGTAMHTRLAAEDKPGATMRSGGPYDGWWNGGIRNTATFHNIIALLTEMIGSPTPMRIPLVLSRQMPGSDLIFPIAPQEWRFRQSVEYSMTTNRAVLDYASRMRENLLWNIYRMGRNSIERGSRDQWTASPHRIAELQARQETAGGAPAGGRGGRAARDSAQDMTDWNTLRAPELRDPRGFIIPADQADFPTATKFVNALLETGITVHRATRGFEVLGNRYPAGSYVVLTAQPFRPHVMDMFEPQEHPNVFPYPGSPPTPPYDHAGWTLAFQMGVQFDRVLEGFDGPFEKIQAWNIPPPAGTVSAAGGAGYVTGWQVKNAVIAANRLLAAGHTLHWLPDGNLHIAAGEGLDRFLEMLAADLGLHFAGRAEALRADTQRLRAPRVGLWDQYGGSMDAGWARWILEQFEFPFERLFAPQLDAGNLRSRFDALVFVGGAIPGAAGTAGSGRGGSAPADVPAEYREHVGRVTVEKTLPEIRRFLEAGGTVIAIGSSAANLAAHLNLPVENHLVENGAPLPRTRFFVPGSVLSARVDTTHPLARGLAERTDFFYDNHPVFKLRGGTPEGVARRIAWFDGRAPLRSGWAWGQQHLEGGVIALEVTVGPGRAVLYGPDILKRAQPHGTFPLLFNALYGSAAQ